MQHLKKGERGHNASAQTTPRLVAAIPQLLGPSAFSTATAVTWERDFGHGKPLVMLCAARSLLAFATCTAFPASPGHLHRLRLSRQSLDQGTGSQAPPLRRAHRLPLRLQGRSRLDHPCCNPHRPKTIPAFAKYAVFVKQEGDARGIWNCWSWGFPCQRQDVSVQGTIYSPLRAASRRQLRIVAEILITMECKRG